MNDKLDEEVFAQHKKQTELAMKIVVTVIVVVTLFTFYVLMMNDS